MVKITVPFEKKIEALNLGVIFRRETRCWYVEKDKAESIVAILGSSPDDIEESPEDIFENNFEDTSPLAPDIITTAPEDFNWASVFEKDNTLYAAYAVGQMGFPAKKEDRIRILKLFARRLPTDYQISFDSLYDFSKSFASIYPYDRIKDLVEAVYSGERPYAEEVSKCSFIDEEEKALLMFVFPF